MNNMYKIKSHCRKCYNRHNKHKTIPYTETTFTDAELAVLFAGETISTMLLLLCPSAELKGKYTIKEHCKWTIRTTKRTTHKWKYTSKTMLIPHHWDQGLLQVPTSYKVLHYMDRITYIDWCSVSVPALLMTVLDAIYPNWIFLDDLRAS